MLPVDGFASRREPAESEREGEAWVGGGADFTGHIQVNERRVKVQPALPQRWILTGGAKLGDALKIQGIFRNRDDFAKLLKVLNC